MPRSAAGRGLKVIIAGAGGAAHLPGMAASMTRLPVLGVPVEIQGAVRPRQPALDRPDAGRRAGRHAGDRQGRARPMPACSPPRSSPPRDAALAGAARGLARRRRPTASPKRPNDRPARLHHRHRRRRPARPDAGAWRRRSSAIAAISTRPTRTPPAAEVAAGFTRGAFDDEAALRPLRRRGRRRHLRVREYPGRRRSPRSPARCRSIRRVEALEIAQDRLTEKEFIRGLGGRPAPFAAVDDRAGLDAALAEIGAPAILKTRRFGYDGKGQARIDARRRGGRGLGGGARRALRARRLRRVRRRILDPALPRRGRRDRRSGTRRATSTRAASSTRSTVPAGAGARGRRSPRPRRWRGASPTRSTMSACWRSNFSRSATRRCSTKWRRGSTIAATGRSRARCTSQFENHIRAICGLPLGATDLDRAAGRDAQPDRRGGRRLARDPRRSAPPTSTSTARARRGPGRKMGHVTRLLND